MTFQSKRIAQVVPEVNESYFLPGIQRGYVWTEQQVVELFDSAMREYPIGAFLFWEVSGELAREQVKYEFIQHHVTDEVYPDTEAFEGRRHHNARAEGEHPERLTLVLDGQQRLTALTIGLTGSVTDRRPNRPRKQESSWFRKRLYLDLLHENDDAGRGRRYSLGFRPVAEEPEGHWVEVPDSVFFSPSAWFPVGDVLGMDSHADVDRVAEGVAEALTAAGADDVPEHRRTAREVLSSLYRAVHDLDLINYHEEFAERRSRIHELFLRVNSSGTKLSTDEQLLSLMMATWAYADDQPVDARAAVNDLLAGLNERYDGQFSFELRFLLRCLLAAAEAPLSFDPEEFDRRTLKRMKRVWQHGGFTDAVVRTVETVADLGLDGRAVRSNNALVAPVAFFHDSPDAPTDPGTAEGRANLLDLLRYHGGIAVNAVYSLQSVTTLRAMTEAVTDADGRFPVEAVHGRLLSTGSSLALDRERLEEFLEEISAATDSGAGRARLALSMAAPERVLDGETELVRLFPRERFHKRRLRDRGIEGAEAERLRDAADDVGNLALLTPAERDRRDQQGAVAWLNGPDSDPARAANAVPEGEHGIGSFESFLSARRAALTDRLIDRYGSVEAADPAPD
jgi:hypothetical protein